MAVSRRHVVFAGIAAFIAWGFVTNWLPTLRFLPYAFLAGACTTAIGSVLLVVSISRGKRFGPISPSASAARYGRKSVAFLHPEKWAAETTALRARNVYTKAPLYTQSVEVSQAIDGLVNVILRDFVSSWYQAISPNPSFTNEVDRSVRAALANVRDRVLGLDWVELTVSRIVPMMTRHLKDFYDAERAVRGKNLTRNVTESEELDLAIAGKYRDGKLHPAASLAYSNTKLIEQQYLRSIVDRLVPLVLPENMTTSSAVSTLIREIVACAVLFPVLQMLADPDTWNQLMEAYGNTVLQDRKTVKKLRAALDEHAPQSPRTAKRQPFPRLSPSDSAARFEKFIRAIRQCNTLSDARRFRSEVASQLRRDAALEGQDPVYIRRLETGKRILDQKVAYLGAGDTARPKFSVETARKPSTGGSRFEQASLREVLHDASGLSYFMEYMDRLHRMRLVQFWIVVDGFRNPLEEDTDEPEPLSDAPTSWTDSDRNDLASIDQSYLALPELKVPPESRDAVKAFLKAGRNATPLQYRSARQAVLRAQSSVYEEMQERHFPDFKKSDLYYKWLALEEASASSAQSRNHDALSDVERPSLPTRPSRKTRLSSKLLGKEPDLRRAVAPSTDLKAAGAVRPLDKEGLSRRSLDDGSARGSLFDDDDLDADPLSMSTQSLDFEPDINRNGGDAKVVDAMQAALNDILDEPVDKDSLLSDSTAHTPQDDSSMRGSFEGAAMLSSVASMDKDKPSLASLGLLGTPSRRGVFSDDLFEDDQEKFPEDEREDSDVNDRTDDESIHEAAPGDLGLAEAIDSLSANIERLVAQETIVDSLYKKAELTNNSAELRILRKSKASLQREIHRKELQRQQYIVQESDNSLYGRATIAITSIMVGTEEDGHEYAMYVVEVRRQAGDQMPAHSWAMARRYSEFHELNKRLRARFPVVRNLEFPRRQMVFKLQKDFLQKRRQALERYLNELLLIPTVCRSREFRAFLSQQAIVTNGANGTQVDTRDFVTRIYNSVTDGMEEFLGNLPVLDQLSLAGQNLISAATSQINALPTVGQDAMSTSEAEAELAAFENKELEPFVKPICDIFLEVFELNRGNNWLRGRAVVVVLHQLLGGTIERKVRDNVKGFLSEEAIAKYINQLRDTVWPGGKMRTPGAPRSNADKAQSRKEAGLLLATLVPDLAASVVGRANAQAASRRILATLNNHRLNTHLAFTLLDEFIHIIFGVTVV